MANQPSFTLALATSNVLLLAALLWPKTPRRAMRWLRYQCRRLFGTPTRTGRPDTKKTMTQATRCADRSYPRMRRADY